MDILISIKDWLVAHWIEWVEIVPIIIALVALYYAALAYRLARKTAHNTATSDLMKLRLQARSCITDVEKSLLTLQSACAANRQTWEQHAQKHYPKLSLHPFATPEEFKHISSIEDQGAKLAVDARNAFSGLNDMTASELEAAIHQTGGVGAQIERLAHRLKDPQPHNLTWA